ncbi:MAG: iron-sulfur cluster assembly scaffold protein [candidate division SR1 bacterium]|nr:iron-sulfur cluster assembly scaffold protein [candidate division SR1 bacterium]
MEIIIKEYSKNPLCHYEMKDPDISRHEGNFICGDDITVYLKIRDNQILEYSYDGNPSTVSLAAASFLSEFLIGATLDEVLTWNYETFIEKGFEVSPRRKRAAMIALLGTRNAIHAYLEDGQEDEFDDLID